MSAAPDSAALPAPVDDGACDHLLGLSAPALALPSSHGTVDLAELAAVLAVLYVYPRTGRPGEAVSPDWDAIPGARGCTAESCAFRDHAAALASLGARVAGLSAQPLHEQVEFAQLHAVPYPVISDTALRLADALTLPTFEFAGARLYKRVTLVFERGKIRRVFYPVFPPERNAADVVAWLEAR